MDRLDEIFAMQKGLAEMMNLDRYPKDPEGRVSALSTAIMHEAEASLELNLTPDDIVQEYRKKNEINRNRQKNGY
ncbi:MAG: hypothetical protein EB167_00125 [Nitrososphaeria archaeon]|nr:hypothetical protein [Nitrososphaeria archaeon]